ncbi:unnamed protein product [Colias eurytheme]|nr:unnamed protein product [Colias eurytheme]
MSKYKYSRGKQLIDLTKANNRVQELNSISIREAQRDLFGNYLEPVVHHSKDIQNDKETSGDSSKKLTSYYNNVDNIKNLELYAKAHDYVDFYQQNDENKSYKGQECPKDTENLNILIGEVEVDHVETLESCNLNEIVDNKSIEEQDENIKKGLVEYSASSEDFSCDDSDNDPTFQLDKDGQDIYSDESMDYQFMEENTGNQKLK